MLSWRIRGKRHYSPESYFGMNKHWGLDKKSWHRVSCSVSHIPRQIPFAGPSFLTYISIARWCRSAGGGQLFQSDIPDTGTIGAEYHQTETSLPRVTTLEAMLSVCLLCMAESSVLTSKAVPLPSRKRIHRTHSRLTTF